MNTAKIKTTEVLTEHTSRTCS